VDFVGEAALMGVKELQVSFMDKRSGLQRVVGAFRAQVSRSNPMQFVVQRRC
jgi:hypothetical protein